MAIVDPPEPKSVHRIIVTAVFAGFAATVDYPGCTYWRELAAVYPDAKVLLTVRDPDAWFESTQATILSPPMRARFAGSPMESFFQKSVWRDFGSRIDDRAFMTEPSARWRGGASNATPRIGRVRFFGPPDLTQERGSRGNFDATAGSRVAPQHRFRWLVM